jgi:Na+/phosphate symporter
MSVLWFALGIYIVGVAVVLFIRPTSMFSASGWKEFGLANTSNYTVFPFWMFAIVWAIISYAFASLFMLTVASGVMSGETVVENTNNNLNLNNIATPVSQVQSAPISVPTPVPSPSPTLPGYYILQETAKGPAKYMYYGPNPPTMESV